MLTPLGRSLASLVMAVALTCSAVAVGAPAYADPAAPAPPAGGGDAVAGSIVEISLPLKGGSTHELALAPQPAPLVLGAIDLGMGLLVGVTQIVISIIDMNSP